MRLTWSTGLPSGEWHDDMREGQSVEAKVSATEASARRVEHDSAGVGPIFISGRQHSGNTVTAHIFGMVPDCYSANVEGWFFEHRRLVDKIKDPAKRAAYVVDLLRLDDAALDERTRDWLVGWHREHPDAASVDVYRQAMRFVTTSSGKRFWVRRATSYIFYAQDILTLMPEARILYLLRNPYDVCASKKRRDPKRDRFLGWVVSWNRGLRIALKLQEAYPNRFLIVRYEDMVTKPVETFRAIFDFAGVLFQARYLDIPHVNRSEAHQTRTSETRGLNPSRVYYYTGILTPTETLVLDMLVWKEKVLEYYPDIPHWKDKPRLSTRIKALGLLATSPFSYAFRLVRLFFRHGPAWRLRRLLRRVRIVVR